MLSRFPYLTGLMLGGALAATAPVRAADAPASNEVVVSRGSAVLTLTDVDARVSKIPLTKRAGFMNSPERIEDTLEKMLIVRQMAEEARGLGMESDPVVQAEVKLAADQALARRWLEKRIAEIKVPDLSAAAKERYLGNKQAYATPETISVRHLLIRTSAHGEEQAIKLATELRAQFLAEGGEFGDFVAAHSEEPAAGDKKGLIEDLVRGQTVGAFEEAAFKLQQPGELSEPVLTRFGAHLIQLIARKPSQQRPFEEVREGILAELHKDFLGAQRNALLDGLRSQTMQPSPDLLLSLRTRYLPDGAGNVAIGTAEGIEEEHEEAR